MSKRLVSLFKDFLNECKLIDLEYKSKAFTWSNRKIGWRNVRDHLDCAVTNKVWKELFQNALLINEFVIGSDYKSNILNLHISSRRGKFSFRFMAKWMMHLTIIGRTISGLQNVWSGY